MPRVETSPSRIIATRSAERRSWWRSVTGLRLSPQLFTWLLLGIGLLASLVSGCSPRHDQAFEQTPQPDLAVTTLSESDIETVAGLINLQSTISRGCDVSLLRPLPTRLQALVQGIREQHRSRERDLDALVLVKNAPLPELVPRQHEMWLEPFTHATSADWAETVISFHRTTQVEMLRLLRVAADHSPDPDVQAFARRQLPGVASTLDQLDRRDSDAH